jgi:hypothetical protein
MLALKTHACIHKIASVGDAETGDKSRIVQLIAYVVEHHAKVLGGR